MIVQLVVTTESTVTNIKLYRRIISILHKNGHVLARDWIEPTYYEMTHGGLKENSDMEELSNIILESIERADVVICHIEGKSTFGLGFQIAIALQKKKPILLLIQKNNKPGAFTTGMKDILITRNSFNEGNLEKVITSFLRENSIKNRDLRFNFVIDRRIYNHLRNKSSHLGKTKAEIVRDIVLEDMQNREP